MLTRRTVLRTGAVTALTVMTTRTLPAGASVPAGPLRAALDQIVRDGNVSAIAEYRDASGVVWRGGSGTAELGGTRPAPVDGRFRIGSTTKTFVATVVLRLVAEGRLRLTDSLDRWLPGLVPGGAGASVHDLLRHTTTDVVHTWPHTALVDYATFIRNRFRTYTPHEIVAMSNALEMQEPEPGTGFSYNNTNYVLLGLIIEQVTGRPYGTEVAQGILRPLGLRHTEVPGARTHLPDPHAHGYYPSDLNSTRLVDVTTCNPTFAHAAGEMISTTADLNRFYRALLRGRLLPPARMRDMFGAPIPATLHYGLGVHRIELTDGTMLWGHGGGFPGYVTLPLSTSDGRRQLTLSVTEGLGPFRPNDLIHAAFGAEVAGGLP